MSGGGGAQAAVSAARKILEVRGLTKRFGGICANDRIDLDVYEGEIVGLIGPNGAGKTTLFNMITGVRPAGQRRYPDAGRIRFMGRDITRLPAHRICRLGLARAFQVVQVLEGMNVLENVAVGALARTDSVTTAKAKAAEILEFTGLAARAEMPAAELTIADKKRLEMARALATEPKLLMLDEVMAGLTPREVDHALTLVRRIHARGVTLILVEHVMEAVMAIAHRVVVLVNGAKVAEGPPEAVVRDERVIKAYLGSD